MPNRESRTGVLLVNLGTPSTPSIGDVRRYLREFLSDPRVIDSNPLARSLLLYAVVLPFRPRRSAAAYAKIWTAQGSPLLVHGHALAEAVQKQLGDELTVALAMRYGEPSIASALEALARGGADRLVVLPLFPQYASSSTGSALQRVYQEAGRHWNVAALRVIEPFYDEPGFIAALCERTRPELDAFAPDHVLMSYHGLPERQIRKSDRVGTHCLRDEHCCDAIGTANPRCYRAQCFATSRALAGALELPGSGWSVSFQSRLGRTPWIRPFTDEVLPELASRGVRRLAVACPSFVADCLETLEEIGLRAAEQWSACGGEALRLVPCLNAHPSWVDAVCAWVRARGAA